MIERILIRNSWIAHAVLWLLIMSCHILFLFMHYKVAFPEALADGLIFNILFAIIGIGIYFITRFSPLRLETLTSIVGFHLVLPLLAITFWLVLGNYLLGVLFPGDQAYLGFLRHSLYIRAILGFLLYLVLSITFRLGKYILESNEQSAREAALINMLRNAEINMLRSQIRPHFLFNSLNSVSALTVSHPDKAREMVIKLADFMRSSLSMGSDSMSTIQDELTTIGLYLDIEKTRFADRLNVTFDVDESCMEHKMPSLILQPLLENAIKHGVNTLLHPSVIKVTVVCSDTGLKVSITNEFDPDAPSAMGTGTGLDNVKKRLAAIYGRYDLLNVKAEANTFDVTLLFPPLVHDSKSRAVHPANP